MEHDSYEHWVWFLAPTWGGSQLPGTTAPGDPMPLLAPQFFFLYYWNLSLPCHRVLTCGSCTYQYVHISCTMQYDISMHACATRSLMPTSLSPHSSPHCVQYLLNQSWIFKSVVSASTCRREHSVLVYLCGLCDGAMTSSSMHPATNRWFPCWVNSWQIFSPVLHTNQLTLLTCSFATQKLLGAIPVIRIHFWSHTGKLFLC